MKPITSLIKSELKFPRKVYDDDDDDENGGNPNYSNSSHSTAASSTANDAISSKFSAITLRYYDDYFLKLMFESQGRTFARKPPIINRGYYTRVKVITDVISMFLRKTSNFDKRQILSLGAGFDTTVYKLFSSSDISLTQGLKYIEVDFEKVVRKKAIFTMKKDVLTKILPSNELASTAPNFKITDGFKFGSYTLLSCDLSDISTFRTLLDRAGVDFTVPTFVLTECVLVYITKQHATELVATIGEIFSDAFWLSYDMVNPLDMFGVQMLNNLTSAGHRIPGFTDFPSLESQKERFSNVGWVGSKSCTMLGAFNYFISEEEKLRLTTLEIFDELEEWELIMNHYALTAAAKGTALIGLLDHVPDM